jgi:hypothetical protein
MPKSVKITISPSTISLERTSSLGQMTSSFRLEEEHLLAERGHFHRRVRKTQLMRPNEISMKRSS